MLSLLSWIAFGFIVGLLARALMPGRQKLGFIATILLGVAGSFVGGFLGNIIFGVQDMNEPHTAGFIGSLIGAFLLLFAVIKLRK